MSTGLEQSEALFFRRWGEMGASWGISRTMAEIHALLYLTIEPLCTDDVMERLQVSRQLVNWGLIHRVHRRGDRKEYFQAETDVWQMFETITRERKRREIQPIVETIERCLEMVDSDVKGPRGKKRRESDTHRSRLTDMLEFLSTMNTLFNLLIRVGRGGVGPVAKMLDLMNANL